MKKIKLPFLLLAVFVAAFALIQINPFQVTRSFEPASDYQLLVISVLGNDLRLVSGDRSLTVNSRDFSLPFSGTLQSDIQTTALLSWGDYRITLFPESRMYYNIRTREINFEGGKFEWSKHTESDPANSHLQNQKQLLQLSEYGRVTVTDDGIDFWNYRGESRLWVEKVEIDIPSGHYIRLAEDGDPVNAEKVPLLDAPEEIYPSHPASPVINIRKSSNAKVTFNWKAVVNADRYIINIYADPLRDNMLLTDTVDSNNYIKNLREFMDVRIFYWEIIPVDEARGLKGIPSRMGRIVTTGAIGGVLQSQEETSRLDIESIEVNDRIIRIEGSVCSDCILYINGERAGVNSSGRFRHRMIFSRPGTYDLNFRLISPGREERELTRKVQVK